MKRRRLALVAALGLLGYAGLRGRMRRYEIAEDSMQPALDPGDYVIAQLRHRPINRGEIVIFEHQERPGFELVKRVVGLPGELVSISNGQIHIDQVVLAEHWADGPTLGDREWQLDSDEVFLLGDNRAASNSDSRTIGPISVGDLRWRVEFRYWPIRAVGPV